MDTRRGSVERVDHHDGREEDAARVIEAGVAGAKGDDEDSRRFPASPKRGSTGTATYGGGGWNAIDELSVYQCARMPAGMQTVEYVPNSLQEEWTEA